MDTVESFFVPIEQRVMKRLLDTNRGAGRSSRRGATDLRTSYDICGLQAGQPSARRGRGELRVSTPQHFCAIVFSECECAASSIVCLFVWPNAIMNWVGWYQGGG